MFHFSQSDLFLDPTTYIPSIPAPTIENSPPPANLRRSSRQSKLPSYLADYYCSLQTETIPLKPPNTPHLLSNVISYSSLSPNSQIFSIGITTDFEPRSYSEAIKYQSWKDAMTSEITVLQANNNWEITTLPPNQKAIGCRWIFGIKYNSNGSINR